MSIQENSGADVEGGTLASKLPRVSARTVQSINNVYGSTPSQSKSGWFCWQRAARPWAARATVTVRVGKDDYVVWLESLTELSSFFNGPHPPWPNQELCSIFDMAAAPMCEALASALGGSLMVTCVRDHHESECMHDGDVVEFSFRTPSMARPVMGRMNVPEVPLLRHNSSKQLDIRDYGEVSVRWRMAVGSIRFLVRQLEEIAPGDVLRCDSALSTGAFAIRLTSARSPFQLVGLAEEGSITIQRIEASTMNRAETAGNTSPKSESAAGADTGNLPIGQIEAELSFDLGDVSFPMSEMARVCPGYIVKLGTNVKNSVVRIRLNGREVGTGGLVVVGDELAVQVTNWAYAKK